MEKRRPIRAFAALTLAAASLAGCAQVDPYQSGGGPSRLWQDNSAQAVTLTDELDAYQYAPHGSIPFDRFEYARRDAQLNAGQPGPLRATQQWEQPTRPPEKRFRFYYWKYE